MVQTKLEYSVGMLTINAFIKIIAFIFIHGAVTPGQAALLQTLTAALSKSVAGDKGGKR
jgi:hypothetical protein